MLSDAKTLVKAMRRKIVFVKVESVHRSRHCYAISVWNEILLGSQIQSTKRHPVNILFSKKLVQLFFSVRLLSVLRGQSFFLSPPQRPMTSDFEDFYTRFYPLHYFHILILEKELVFPFWMFSAKQGNYWYHFFNVFGMTRSLTGEWTRDLPHSKPALYH